MRNLIIPVLIVLFASCDKEKVLPPDDNNPDPAHYEYTITFPDTENTHTIADGDASVDEIDTQWEFFISDQLVQFIDKADVNADSVEWHNTTGSQFGTFHFTDDTLYGWWDEVSGIDTIFYSFHSI